MSQRLGQAKVDITPDFEVELSGYAARVQPCIGVHDPVYLRAIYLEAGSERLLWIHGDLLAFPNHLVARMKNRLGKLFGLGGQQIILSATHTHSAPTVQPLFCAGENPDRYVDWLESRIEEAAAGAIGTVEMVEPVFGESRCAIAIDRRKKGSAHLDQRAAVVGWKRSDGSWAALLANFPVHHVAYSWDNREISADMAGVAAGRLEEILPGGPLVLLTNGASANLNPPFLTSNPNKVREWGDEIARALLEATEGAKPIGDGLKSSETMVPIPLHTLEESAVVVDCFMEQVRNQSGALASIAEANDPAFLDGQLRAAGETWRDKMNRDAANRAIPGALPLAIQTVQFGEVKFVLFAGEMFSVSADELRAAVGGSLYVVGFANGYNGYICPDQVYSEGGYEPDMAFIFGGIPRPRRGAHELALKAALDLVRQEGSC